MTATQDPLTGLADELGHIGSRLEDMGHELRALRAASGGEFGEGRSAGDAVPTPLAADPPVGGHGAPGAEPPAGLGPVPTAAPGWAPPAPVGQWMPAVFGGPASGWVPASHAPGVPHGRAPGRAPGVPRGQVAGWSPAGPPPAAPRRSPLTGARLLAWTGGAVTLLGVVLLLALAASRGWFTPPARVAFGAVLGAGLVGLGMWLHRRETARAGALALVATGFAALYLVDAAAAAIFGFLPALPALALALAVAGAGLGLADRWRSELLAGGVVAGAAVLAPALADGWLLVALVLVLQLAALMVVLRRRWAVLMLLAAAGPVLYGLRAAVVEPSAFAVAAVAAAVLVVALGTAALAGRRREEGPAAAPVGTATRTWIGSVTTVAATAVLPALAAAPVLGGLRGALLAGGAAALPAILALLPTTPHPVKVGAGAAAATALLTATVVGLHGGAAVLAVLGEAVVAALVATGLRSRFAMVVALVLGALGWLAAVHEYAPIATLVQFTVAPAVPQLVTAVAADALALALAAALLVAGGRLGWIRPDAGRAAVWVPIGLVGLYGATGVVVNAALLVSPTSAGFTAGHAIVTVSWTVAALILLVRGLRRAALRVAGLVLVAAAVAKLVLFDLVALDGAARVA
ncbi:MAG: DUF2339 domain-containing protein, partial [Pseudonocardia sp.]|nr:DUF2339 domain-containing protein [Pseudonocardia sp.]